MASPANTYSPLGPSSSRSGGTRKTPGSPPDGVLDDEQGGDGRFPVWRRELDRGEVPLSLRGRLLPAEAPGDVPGAEHGDEGDRRRPARRASRPATARPSSGAGGAVGRCGIPYVPAWVSLYNASAAGGHPATSPDDVEEAEARGGAHRGVERAAPPTARTSSTPGKSRPGLTVVRQVQALLEHRHARRPDGVQGDGRRDRGVEALLRRARPPRPVRAGPSWAVAPRPGRPGRRSAPQRPASPRRTAPGSSRAEGRRPRPPRATRRSAAPGRRPRRRRGARESPLRPTAARRSARSAVSRSIPVTGRGPTPAIVLLDPARHQIADRPAVGDAVADVRRRDRRSSGRRARHLGRRPSAPPRRRSASGASPGRGATESVHVESSASGSCHVSSCSRESDPRMKTRVGPGYRSSSARACRACRRGPGRSRRRRR